MEISDHTHTHTKKINQNRYLEVKDSFGPFIATGLWVKEDNVVHTRGAKFPDKSGNPAFFSMTSWHLSCVPM